MSPLDIQNRHAGESPAVGPLEFRAACGLFPSGVTVVTRRLADGQPHGMTISSFTPLSLDPPLVLICIDRGARFLDRLRPDHTFAINVLSERQQHLATRFSNREEKDRFHGVDWAPGRDDVPVLTGIVASFICTLERTMEGGDHLILLGAVREIARHHGRALVWCERNYHCLPPPPALKR